MPVAEELIRYIHMFKNSEKYYTSKEGTMSKFVAKWCPSNLAEVNILAQSNYINQYIEEL